MKPCKHWLLQTSHRYAIGRTTMALLIGIQLSIQYGSRVLLVHDEHSSQRFQTIFTRSNKIGTEPIEDQLMGGYHHAVLEGWGAIERLARSQQLTPELFVTATTPMIPQLDRLEIPDQGVHGIMDINQDMPMEYWERITSSAASAYDIILWDIDLQHEVLMGINHLGRLHLMPQEMNVLDYIQSRLIDDEQIKHQIGIFNMHDEQLSMNIQYIKRKCKGAKLYALAYDSGIRQSMAEGTLIPYYLKEHHRKERKEQVPLVEGIAVLAKGIMDLSHAIGRSGWEGDKRWG